MSGNLTAGMKFKPRWRKAGHDARFNELIIEVVDSTPDSRGKVLVSSWNARIGTKKRQFISVMRLLSSEYRLVIAPGPLAEKPVEAVLTNPSVMAGPC